MCMCVIPMKTEQPRFCRFKIKIDYSERLTLYHFKKRLVKNIGNSWNVLKYSPRTVALNNRSYCTVRKAEFFLAFKIEDMLKVREQLLLFCMDAWPRFKSLVSLELVVEEEGSSPHTVYSRNLLAE